MSGSDAPRADPIAEEHVTVTFDYDGADRSGARAAGSARGGGVRRRRAADPQWGAYLEAADVRPTMIVGAHRTDDEDEMVRIREYSPPFDEQRFAAHEKFFMQDIRRWVRSRFGITMPAERTAVCGVSASGEFSIAMGLRRPDVYGAVFSASPGCGYRPPDVMPRVLPRTYLVAGTREPFFRDNAIRWADALRDAGAEVVMVERVGGHGDPFWAAEFPRMVAWAFGP
ncbi:esterase family protein [Allobranchiibius sp. GilTou73]|uniref:alpha/beta hydrolase n=1 Tax=Allobranchiibius sp. GilTou73 TaxID=2904523 RepID=UPI001F17D6AF|nr:alpha/beta hydrolase-fold protein [Allobranchiibius sp. GilTou73]UIJ35406.1 esterase family protein [Allobranchiibius sp. GilTou73]